LSAQVKTRSFQNPTKERDKQKSGGKNLRMVRTDQILSLRHGRNNKKAVLGEKKGKEKAFLKKEWPWAKCGEVKKKG